MFGTHQFRNRIEVLMGFAILQALKDKEQRSILRLRVWFGCREIPQTTTFFQNNNKNKLT